MLSIINFDDYDYYYFNHALKKVLFKYKFKKPLRTKVTIFLKQTHEEAKIIKFLDELDLKLIKIRSSRKYIYYDIVDKENK